MVPEPDNPETEKFTIDAETNYSTLKEKSVDELMAAFRILNPIEGIKLVTAYCIAKCLSRDVEENGKSLGEEIRIEYLKEYGRNARATLKNDGSSAGDEDGDLFPRP